MRLLVGPDVKRKTVYGSPPTASECKDYSYRRSVNEQSIVLHGPVANYPVTSDYKTVARLERGDQFPTVGAMSGWSHPERPSIRVSGRDWTNEVFRIATVVGHILTLDFQRDQGLPGQFYASHAEKQLIAYFIDRHVFLPQDRVPRPELKTSIMEVEDQLMNRSFSSAIITQLYNLEREKKMLELELFDKDDSLLGDEYDEKKVKQPRGDIKNVKKQLSELESCADVMRIRELEHQLQNLKQRQAVHQRLIDMSKNPPPVSLTKSVILISSGSGVICPDCKLFKAKVNRCLGLSIELVECTENNREIC